MNITQFEQSGFIITSNSGATLAIDIGALTPIEKLADTTVDALLISHIHADHCSTAHATALAPNTIYTGAECAAVLAETHLPVQEITAGAVVSIGDFSVTPFAVDHGPHAPQVPAQNFGFLIEVDGQTIYFAGDMFTSSGITVNDLEVDIALLPVGGHFTFDAKSAFAFAQTFKSIGTIYPVHFEAVGPIDTHGKEKFIELAQGSFEII